MAYVYILYSPSVDSFYIGSCKDFEERLEQHLKGEFKRSFSKRATDWEKYLVMENLSYSHARQIEFHIKKMKSRKFLSNLKDYAEMRLKLIAKFDAGSSR